MNAPFNTTALAPASPPPLNQGQKNAADVFFQFLFSEGKEMIISGPGGVGKTFLMGHLIDAIIPRYQETCRLMGIMPEFDSVEMTATTNKAAEALGDATQRPTNTIHSLLNLTVKNDYSTGKQKLTRARNWHPHERKIIFIDECSMIDSDLLEEIRAGTLKCKIIYVGDHCQLAPVGETLSPIYRCGLPFVELTEPMRTGIPELINLNQQLRNTVETGEFWPIQIIPGVIDLLTPDQMQMQLAQTFQGQTQESRILAYTNKQVINYNEFLRHDVRQLGSEFGVGELLVNNSAVQLSRTMISVEEPVEIVKQVQDIEYITIEKDVELAVRRSDLKTKFSGILADVMLPADRDHFHALLQYYQKQKNWERYFFLKDKFPDLRQRDAATVHKAQGSTYNSVFIDLGNISTCNIPSQVARMLYVAVSRPRFQIFFYGNLAEKYGGLIK